MTAVPLPAFLFNVLAPLPTLITKFSIYFLEKLNCWNFMNKWSSRHILENIVLISDFTVRKRDRPPQRGESVRHFGTVSGSPQIAALLEAGGDWQPTVGG